MILKKFYLSYFLFDIIKIAENEYWALLLDSCSLDQSSYNNDCQLKF